MDRIRTSFPSIVSTVPCTLAVRASFLTVSVYVLSTKILMQEAMHIPRRTGKRDLFITMGCDPDCPEIWEQLLPGQTAMDCLDAVHEASMPRSRLWST